MNYVNVLMERSIGRSEKTKNKSKQNSKKVIIVILINQKNKKSADDVLPSWLKGVLTNEFSSNAGLELRGLRLVLSNIQVSN